MADSNPAGAELLPYVVSFSDIISEFTPNHWAARRYLYATIFVRAAQGKRQIPRVLAEFEQEWKTRPLGLKDLLPGLVDYFGDLNDPDWSWVRYDILRFYTAYRDNALLTKVPQSFRPLASMYHSVRKDVERLQECKMERLRTSQELQNELKEFAKRNPKAQCPVPRRYVTLPKTADLDIIWAVKEEAFILIFQRTRELFHSQCEEAHFHHAASIIDFWHASLKRKHKPDSRNDDAAFEKQAKDLKTFQRVYVGILESSQKNLRIEGVVKYVTDKMNLSQGFKPVRYAANRVYERRVKLLGEVSYVLPAVVNRKASLASALYEMLHERRKLYDEVAHITDKITKQLQQLHGWEEMTGSKLLQEVPSQAQATEATEATEAPGGEGSAQNLAAVYPTDSDPMFD